MAKDRDISIEQSLPIVDINGLNTNKDTYLGGTLEVVGAQTFTGAANFATIAASSTITAGGAVTATGAIGTKSTITATGIITAKDATAMTATAAQAIQMSTTTSFGIFYGNGVPAATAATGSIYLNLGGSTTGTRMYVNAGGATWYGMVSGT